MGEYDRTGNGQSSKTDWDLRSILCDIAKNWWVILLIACSAAMITYTVMATVHKDRYTVKTTFAVMGRGVDALSLIHIWPRPRNSSIRRSTSLS